MRTGYLIAGIILMIVAGILFYLSITAARNIAYNEQLSQIPFFSQGNHDYETDKAFAGSCILISIVLGIVGFVFSIYGAFSNEAVKKKNVYNKPVATPTKIIEPTSQDEALSILRTRYANGEITKEQFEQMKKDLEK